MTLTWAAKVLEGVPRHDVYDVQKADNWGAQIWLSEADALAAIARMGAGDGLVERATAALEGVTPGNWKAHHTEDYSMLVIHQPQFTQIGHMYEAGDATFVEFARQWVPEAAAHIAALTAQNREMALDVLASSGQAAEAYAAQLAAEAERDALRAKVALLEGAVIRLRECVHGILGAEMQDADRIGDALAIIDAALTDGAADE